jgi:hypothetical protein
VGVRVGLDREAGGKILCLCRGSNPGRPIVLSVAGDFTELPRLPNKWSYNQVNDLIAVTWLCEDLRWTHTHTDSYECRNNSLVSSNRRNVGNFNDPQTPSLRTAVKTKTRNDA